MSRDIFWLCYPSLGGGCMALYEKRPETCSVCGRQRAPILMTRELILDGGTTPEAMLEQTRLALVGSA